MPNENHQTFDITGATTEEKIAKLAKIFLTKIDGDVIIKLKNPKEDASYAVI